MADRPFSMRIVLVTPAPPGSKKGNRITAMRWARFLRELGHRVTIAQQYQGQPCDALIALHARRSAKAIFCFRERHPEKPLVVALTGTDLYQDIHHNASARRSLEVASHLIVLQSLAHHELPKRMHKKIHVIYQSVKPPRRLPRPIQSAFEVCVMGHLRPVKDPFRTAIALGLLPADSRIRVIHLGAALSKAMKQRAEDLSATNARYRWLGELPRWKARRLLSRSRLLVMSSKSEGGPSVVSEALAARVPILATKIPGIVGILGKDYPGYFPVGNTTRLAALLEKSETDVKYYNLLKTHCRRVAPLVKPEKERRCWKRFMRELAR